MSENKNTEENFVPWKAYPNIWKTESAWWAWLRSLLRKGWSKSPIKLEFIKQKRIRVVGNAGNEVWGGECAICKKCFLAKDMNVDHIVDAGRLTKIEDITPFVQNLLMCPASKLQYVCIPCHKIKSHSDRKNISHFEASAEKRAIAIIKEKKEKEVLAEAGISPASNAKGRREQLISLFSQM